MKSLRWLGPLAAGLLVYPGLGHFFLRRFRRGILWGLTFTLPMLGCLYLVGTELTTIYAKLLSPTGDPNFNVTPLIQALGLTLVGMLVYVGAAVDCFWLSKSLKPLPDLPSEP